MQSKSSAKDVIIGFIILICLRLCGGRRRGRVQGVWLAHGAQRGPVPVERSGSGIGSAVVAARRLVVMDSGVGGGSWSGRFAGVLEPSWTASRDNSGWGTDGVTGLVWRVRRWASIRKVELIWQPKRQAGTGQSYRHWREPGESHFNQVTERVRSSGVRIPPGGDIGKIVERRLRDLVNDGEPTSGAAFTSLSRMGPIARGCFGMSRSRGSPRVRSADAHQRDCRRRTKI